jgi:hypothetical protein
MLRHLLVALGLLGGVGAASAEPLLLSDQQLDTVTGGGLILAADFQRIIRNGERGFSVTVLEFDEATGQFSTRTFERIFTIPVVDLPSIPTIAFDVTIATPPR